MSKPKFTPWFDDSINPVRPGIYQVWPFGYVKYSYWDGKRWGFRMRDKDTAYKFRERPALGPVVQWRGLARKP